MALIPVDEGEAEAQPNLPPVTIRLLDGPLDEFPRHVRFEVPAGGKRRSLDAFLSERAEEYLRQAGLVAETDPRPDWHDTEDDGRVRAVTYTVTGWLDAE